MRTSPAPSVSSALTRPEARPISWHAGSRRNSPIAWASRSWWTIAAHPSLKASSTKELIELAKARPDTVKYSTPGTGSTDHLAGALLETMAGIRLVHLPYKGSGPALTGMLGGEVDLIGEDMTRAAKVIRSAGIQARAAN